MITKVIFIQGLNKEVMFHIGTNQAENFEVLDKGLENDLWFHANKESSCHIVAVLPEGFEKKNIKYIVKQGALLCKNNTNKLKSKNNVEIIYTEIKNIVKTNIQGMVNILNKKIITI